VRRLIRTKPAKVNYRASIRLSAPQGVDATPLFAGRMYIFPTRLNFSPSSFAGKSGAIYSLTLFSRVQETRRARNDHG
jgi:hypothetical protein